MWKELWNELWNHHRAKTIGVIMGFILAVIYLIFGFWDMLMFGFIILVGYYIGQKIDAGDRLFDFEAFVKWITDRWRMFK